MSMQVNNEPVLPFIKTYKELIDFFLPTPDPMEKKEEKLFDKDMFEIFDKSLVQRLLKANNEAVRIQRMEISQTKNEKERYRKLRDLEILEKQMKSHIEKEMQNVHEISLVGVTKEVAQQFLYNLRRKAVIKNHTIDPICDLAEFILMVDKVGVIRQGNHFLLGYTLYSDDVLAEAEKKMEAKYLELYNLLVIDNQYITIENKYRDLPASY
ncbi:MAG TPA: hypothetical protein VM577_03705 [Anaerovoracaceae bacterium]|nr:hypothetical protein [Anaerovoracaceae bacterium]